MARALERGFIAAQQPWRTVGNKERLGDMCRAIKVLWARVWAQRNCRGALALPF